MEDALLNAGKKAKLGDDLAKRCQEALDEHHWAMWKTVCNDEDILKMLGNLGTGRTPTEALTQALQKMGKALPAGTAAQGRAWFAQGWQEREKKLFVLAGEVAAKLGRK